jgi:eukaryotic-like serine/threonine-protein kinase
VNASGLSASDPQRVGRYSVLRRIGRGGMSTVYEAYDPELDRRIALKLVTAWDANGDQGPARLVREARAMAKISHPNVAPVYDVGVYDDAVFIAMELIDGPTLEAWTTRTARPWTEILRMYLLAGRGLAAAHDAGLIHRDFKPDNVMVGPDDRPRVLDFGLARPAALDGEDTLLPADDDDLFDPSELDARIDADGPRSPTTAPSPEPEPEPGSRPGGIISSSFDLVVDVTRNGVVTGTPAYMASEQHQGAAGGPASDQFAFCVSLWEALYRQRPYIGKTYFAIADAIIEGQLQAPPPNSHVPRWIRNLLERGLAVEPDARHPSMRSLLGSFVFTFKVMHGLS